MKVIYIAGPFRSKATPYNYYEQHHHILRAESLAWEVWKRGAAAISPHLNTIHFQGSLPDDVWLDGDLEIMKRCDAVLMVQGWEKSSGAVEERRVALDEGIPVLYDLDELEKFLDG